MRIENIAMYDSVEDAHEHYRKYGAVIEEKNRTGMGDGPHTRRVRQYTSHSYCYYPKRKKRAGDQLFHPSLRMGREGSFVDNFSAGGISALIDPDSGVIYTDGADKKGHSYECHPDSKVNDLKGFGISPVGGSCSNGKGSSDDDPGQPLLRMGSGFCQGQRLVHG